MCQFKSAIVLRNGDILANQYTDSHEDLIRLFKLRDTKEGAFARVEFTPESPDTMDDEKTYKLRIDEQREPEWFDGERKEKVAATMRGWIKAMIISGDVDLLCGGAYIVAKNAKIASVKNVLIHVMMPGSKVGEMWGSSNVGVMRGSSKVGVMWESSKVGEMWGSSNVGVMRGSSNVGEMRGSRFSQTRTGNNRRRNNLWTQTHLE